MVVAATADNFQQSPQYRYLIRYAKNPDVINVRVINDTRQRESRKKNPPGTRTAVAIYLSLTS